MRPRCTIEHDDFFLQYVKEVLIISIINLRKNVAMSNVHRAKNRKALHIHLLRNNSELLSLRYGNYQLVEINSGMAHVGETKA